MGIVSTVGIMGMGIMDIMDMKDITTIKTSSHSVGSDLELHSDLASQRYYSAVYSLQCGHCWHCSGHKKRDHEVVVVRRTINLDTVNLEWGGLRKGRSVSE
jgi:hypothetical protein